MQRLSRRARWATGAAGVVAGAAAAAALVRGGYEVAPELLPPTLVLSLAVGWSFIGVGLVAWTRRPDSRTGLLMVALGFAWFARYTVAVAAGPAFVVGVLLGSVHLSVLVHLLATFPDGRVHDRVERTVVAVGYLLSAPLDALFLVAFGATRGLGEGPPPNGLVIAPTNGEFDPAAVDLVVQSAVVALFLALLAVVFRRWRAAGPAQRRSLAPGVIGGATIVGTILVERTAILLLIPPAVGVVLAWAAQVVLVVWPLALLLGLLRSHLDRTAVSRLVVELGAGTPVPARLRSALARTLHDPTLQLAYWLPDREAFVDSGGVQVALDGGGRTVTYLDRDGERVAVLVHDPALDAEPELVAAVAASAGLAVQNERLQAEVRHQLREVHASRARIVEAADAARRRVERDLHDGAQQRLVTVALALRLARTQLGAVPPEELAGLLDEAGAELSGALDELRELARGIYPVLLTDAGLGPALVALAERSPVAATVGPVPDRRWPDAVEQTCYFVVSEALANAAKHADASSVVIDLRPDGGELCVEVRDDGRGGADPAGSGLRGLADRVAAVGGHLAVDGPPGAGTRVVARLPCG